MRAAYPQTMQRSIPKSYRELLNGRHRDYFIGIEQGNYQPFVYPYGTFAAFILICCIFLPHRRKPLIRYAKYVALAVIICLCIDVIRRSKGVAFGNGYYIGMSRLFFRRSAVLV